MDSLSKKIQNLGIHDIRNAARFAQNVIVQYEPYQVDVRRATNTDSWGPTPKHLQKVLRNRYQVPLYLITEYILKRLIDHIAARPKNLYEKARKDYVNYGSEWRVVMKCLIVVEYIMLNVDSGDELNQVKSCLNTHKHILTRQVAQYKIPFSNDGKMEVHERGIRKKGEIITQFLEDSQFLKKERAKNKKNNLKIRQQTESSMYNANTTASTNDDEDEDDFDEDDYEIANTHPNAQAPQRKRSTLEEQRRQRREVLRERIRNTEQQRKTREQEAKNAAIPDLIDFDAPAPTSTSSAAANTSADDDDDFGDFQSDNSPKPAQVSASASASSPANKNLDDLLNFAGNSTPAAAAPAATQKKDDVFADLFNNSKSLI